MNRILFFIIAAVQAITATAWAEGNGRSLPVLTPQPLIRSDLKKLDRCIQELNQDLLKQDILEAVFREWKPETMDPVSVSWSSNSWLAKLIIRYRDGHRQGSFEITSSALGSFFGIVSNQGGRITFETQEPLPFFKFEAIPQADRFGRFLPELEVLTNLELVYPGNYGSQVPLFNSETHAITDLTVNEEKLVQCFLSEIQGSVFDLNMENQSEHSPGAASEVHAENQSEASSETWTELE